MGEVVHRAITTDRPQLRYACSWAGPEAVAGRAAMSDEDWVALGAHADDDDYYAEFRRHFGVDIAVLLSGEVGGLEWVVRKVAETIDRCGWWSGRRYDG